MTVTAKKQPKKHRTGPGKGVRVKIDVPFTVALRTSLRRKRPATGWPKAPAAPKAEEE